VDQIDALRLFARLAQRGSFSAAAKDLKIKQSTASKWVAELESQLSSNLVRRTTRSVHITDSGQRLLARAQDVLSAFDELTSEFEGRNPEPAGRIRMSVPVVFGRRFVVPAVAEFLRRHRQVAVELVFNDRYVNLVQEGFDLAVRVGIPADGSDRGRKLADSRRVLVASPAYLGSRAAPRSPKDLKQHECLVHGDGNVAMVWRFARDSGADIPVAVRGRVTANNSEAVLQMARRGFGVALLADWLVKEDLRRGRLLPMLQEFVAPSAPIYALRPPGKFASRTARALTDHLARSLAVRLAAEGPSGR
jgi:DNA-binding transcriptional LysR family regulator